MGMGTGRVCSKEQERGGQVAGEQDFAYEKTEKGIRILRCYGVSSTVSVPGELEGLPVTELADYAFADGMENEPENTSGLPCICGNDLEELYLPESIRRLGRYVFYNCLQFRKLSCYSTVSYMGAGGFTGCGRLSHLEMHQKAGPSCLRELLQDLKQTVLVDCYLKDKSQKEDLACRLVYPEFFEEAVENTPARIISTQTHGMGIQYRNTFRNTQIVFPEYDKLFETGKYNMDTAAIIEMAVERLSYPYALSGHARAEYALWLREHLEEGAAYFLGQGRAKEVKWLAESFAETREELELLLKAANRQSGTGFVSLLMDALHRRFPAKKKKFAL